MHADASLIALNEDDYSNAFKAVVGAYCEESFESVEEAERAFNDRLIEEGLIEE